MTLVPDFGQVESYVIESSTKNLVKGVGRLPNLDSIDLDEGGIVIYSHVLEHVADPKEAVIELLRHASLVYIEVPFGVPEVSKTRRSLIRLAFKALSSYSTFFWRQFAKPATGRNSHNGVLIQSEHINFFSTQSLRVLANKIGVEAIIEVNSIYTPDKSQARVIQCLFRSHFE